MRSPTPPRTIRASTVVDEIDHGTAAALARIREALQPEDGTQLDLDLCTVETTLCVAVRLMRKTNPSKVRDVARTVEIKARMDGLPVLRGAA